MRSQYDQHREDDRHTLLTNCSCTLNDECGQCKNQVERTLASQNLANKIIKLMTEAKELVATCQSVVSVIHHLQAPH